MTDNLLLGPDAQIRFTLQRLKAHAGQSEITAPTTEILEGVLLANDPEAAITGRFQSDEGRMLALSMQPAEEKKPRWQGLHVALGAVDFSDASVIGVLARSSAPSSITTRICLRAGRGEDFIDTFFSKTMVSFAEPSTHLDVIEIASKLDLPRQAPWCELVFFFRPGEVDLDLLDLRVFIV